MAAHQNRSGTLVVACAVLAAVLAIAVDVARAARPMVTDDARLVDAKACQLEAWTRTNPEGREYWALPGCNFSGNLELTLGGGRFKGPDEPRTSDAVLQGKTLFRRMEPNGWGTGLALGTIRHAERALQRSRDVYAYLPTSFSFRDDRFVVHTNLGWLREGGTGKDSLTWGVGSETQFARRAHLIAEIFGRNHGHPFYQIGVRAWVVPDRVQLDATFGDRFGDAVGERWFTVGLRLLSPAFLP